MVEDIEHFPSIFQYFHFTNVAIYPRSAYSLWKHTFFTHGPDEMKWSFSFTLGWRRNRCSTFFWWGEWGGTGGLCESRVREVNRIIPIRIDIWKFNNIPYIRIIHRRTATRIVYKHIWRLQPISLGLNLTWFIVRLLFEHVHSNVNVYRRWEICRFYRFTVVVSIVILGDESFIGD